MVNRWLAACFVALAILAGLIWPVGAQASSLARLVIGGNFVLESGEVLDEDLTILGGNAVLEQDSLVRGDVQILGGRLEVHGTVDGEVLAAGGVLKLGETAVIKDDVTVAGGVLERDSGAVIGGKLITETDVPFNISRFDGVRTPFRWWLNSLWNVIWYIGLAFALSALAVLVMMFFDKQTERTTRVILEQPTVATGLGCLTIVVAPFALIILVLTICLMPVALVAILIIGVAITFGWIALGLEVGRRLAILVQRDWASPFAAGIGTFALVLVGALLNIIPFIGWVYTTLISAAGIGAVLLTRFGTQDYTPGQGARVPSLDEGTSSPATYPDEIRD
jgi:hypothetical protein